MKNKENTRCTDINMEGFTLPLAIVDALPVLFFGGSSIVISMMFKSHLFSIGAVLSLSAGLGKVIWKVFLALKKRNYKWLNLQFRYTMSLGFALMLISFIADIKSLDMRAIASSISSLPSSAFFLTGIIGIAAMAVFSKKLDGSLAKSNWIEQIVNAIAQASFFIGLLLIL